MKGSEMKWVGTTTDPVYRSIHCPFCRWRSQRRRHGIGANALATAGRLRGDLWKHIKAKHPQKID